MSKNHLRLVKTTSSSSGSQPDPESCAKCSYYVAPDGCACSQLQRLMPGGQFHFAAPRAKANMQSPHYMNDCPCPDCFMTRRWERDGVTRPPMLSEARGFSAEYPLPGRYLHPTQAYLSQEGPPIVE